MPPRLLRGKKKKKSGAGTVKGARGFELSVHVPVSTVTALFGTHVDTAALGTLDDGGVAIKVPVTLATTVSTIVQRVVDAATELVHTPAASASQERVRLALESPLNPEHTVEQAGIGPTSRVQLVIGEAAERVTVAAGRGSVRFALRSAAAAAAGAGAGAGAGVNMRNFVEDMAAAASTPLGDSDSDDTTIYTSDSDVSGYNELYADMEQEARRLGVGVDGEWPIGGPAMVSYERLLRAMDPESALADRTHPGASIDPLDFAAVESPVHIGPRAPRRSPARPPPMRRGDTTS